MRAAATTADSDVDQRRWRMARQRRRWLLAITIAVTVLMIAGIGGRSITRNDSDLPPIDQLIRDGTEIYVAAAPGISDWRMATHDHAPIARIAKQVVVATNGQIDARILQYVGLALDLASIAIVLWLIRRSVRLPTIAALGGFAILLRLTPGWNQLLGGDSFAASAFVLFSLVHIGLVIRSPRPAWARGIGWLFGALNIIANSAGAASALAVTACDVLAHRRNTSRVNGRVLINGSLAIVGFTLIALRTLAGARFAAHGNLLSWPFDSGWAGLLVWAPSLAATAILLSYGRRGSHETALLPLSLWAVLGALLLACTMNDVRAAAPFIAVAILINSISLIALPAKGVSAHTLRLGLGVIWMVFVGQALVDDNHNAPDSDSPATTATNFAKAVRFGDVSAIRNQVDSAQWNALESLLHDSSFRSILPVSAREPLAIAESRESRSHAFRPDAVLSLREREFLPAYGTWNRDQSASTGKFVSSPIATHFPYLQLRIGGSLAPPQTTIALEEQDGRLMTPLTASLTATDRWRRVNFVAPKGPFRVIAESRDPKTWFGFTAPVEVGALTRLIGKIPRWWPKAPLWLGGSIAVLLGLSFILRASVGQRLPALNWRVIPWIALLGYAIYFAHHIDPTAGPNDSGGYLNSAKLLVSGHVTTEPRRIFPSVPHEDITPYLPITFHAQNGRMIPEYPVGWPLEVATLGKIVGLRYGVPLLIIAQLLVGVIITQKIGRTLGLPEAWAWLGAGIVALSPVYLFEALQPVSDGPALVWVTTAVYWGWLSRERPRYAIWCGVATALAVLIRPSNLLCVAPIMICLAGSWRRFIWWALAGIPGALFLCWYQSALYGNWHTTGYGDMSSGFGLQFAPLTIRSYAMWLPEFLTPFVLLAVALPFLRSTPARVRLLLGIWIAAFLIFYAVYWCTWDSWFNMRFVLPAFPAMIIAALLVARDLAMRFRWALFTSPLTPRSLLLSAALVLGTLGFLTVRSANRDVTYWMWSNQKPRLAVEWLRDRAPANAVVFAKHLSGSLFYYTDLPFVRLDHPVAQQPEWYDRIATAGRPMYAVTCHWETRGFKWEDGHQGSGYPDLPGDWERLALLCEGEMMVWKRK